MSQSTSFSLFQALPNIITLGRLILAPFVIVAIVDNAWGQAFGLFLLAGISDALDGFLAKRFDLRSELGAFLDPLADKALLIALYVTLAVIHDIPAALAILVVARDLLIMGGVLVAWLFDRPIAIKPHAVSKANTAAQISFVAILLGCRAFGVAMGPFYDIGVYVVAALTLASAASYLVPWLKHMAT